MLTGRALLVLIVLFLVMLAGDSWQKIHGVKVSLALFGPPMVVIGLVVAFAERERAAMASAEAVTAWKRWGSVFAVSCAAMMTVGQLLPVVPSLGFGLPESTPVYRLLVAGCGLVIIAVSNRMPKLPPLLPRRPGLLALGMPQQLALSRFMGLLLVMFGVTVIVGALLSWRIMGLVISSASLATVAMGFVKRYQLMRAGTPPLGGG